MLLIDADLRRPSLHEVFDLPNATGLTDGLRSGRDGPLPLIEMSPPPDGPARRTRRITTRWPA